MNTNSSVDDQKRGPSVLLTEIPFIGLPQRDPSPQNHSIHFPGTTKNVGNVTFITKEKLKIIRTTNNSLNSS